MCQRSNEYQNWVQALYFDLTVLKCQPTIVVLTSLSHGDYALQLINEPILHKSQSKSSRSIFKCPQGHIVKHTARRILNPPANLKCNHCGAAFAKKLQIHSCEPCNYDICKGCRQAQKDDAPSCYKFHYCTRGQIQAKRKCVECHQDKEQTAWFLCEPCNYFLCVECHSPDQVKCPAQHRLHLDKSENQICTFCQQTDWPGMRCKNAACHFFICFACCCIDSSDQFTKKDTLSHTSKRKPLDTVAKQVACDYCGQLKFPDQVYQCSPCNSSTCVRCIENLQCWERNFSLPKSVFRSKTKVFHVRPNHIEIDCTSDGILRGSALRLVLRGYRYLQYVVFQLYEKNKYVGCRYIGQLSNNGESMAGWYQMGDADYECSFELL